MTFVITMGNSDQIIQLSDRRLSSNGIPVDDEANKAGILTLPNARFAYGFTGLAKIGTFSTRDWLLEAIYDCAPPDYQLGALLDRLAIKAAVDFQRNPSIARLPDDQRILTVLLSGYLNIDDPPLMGCAILSNYSGYKTDHTQAFQVRCWKERRPLVGEPTQIERVGQWTSFSMADDMQIRELLRQRKPAEAIIGKAVSVIRKLADFPRTDNTVGKQLSTIIIPRDPTKEITANYESATLKNIACYPDKIVAFADDHRLMMKEVSLSSDGTAPVVVPRVGRNHPCPCGSGLKYKYCHGHIR